MDIVRHETFGPVLCILRVRDEEEAVRLANDTEYGLGSTVFSRDQRRARRIAGRIVAGSSCVNDFSMGYMANELPFGGVRGSGFGRLNGREGLRACTNIKSVVADRFPLHRPVRLYPVQEKDYAVTKHTVELIYGSGLWRRGRSALALLRRMLSG
jgi:hypothetical protein